MALASCPRHHEIEVNPSWARDVRVLVIDNFDSFTFNLVQYLGALGAEPTVVRNNAITTEQILKLAPDRILISPGPGNPDEAGISRQVIRAVAGKIPILGVCLGHQCLGEVFGGRTVRYPPVHGKVSSVHHDGRGIFRGVANPLTVARYHSLVVDPDTLDPEVEISARTEEGAVMGLRHRHLPVEGIQFHPESFMTPAGLRMIKNFLAPG